MKPLLSLTRLAHLFWSKLGRAPMYSTLFKEKRFKEFPQCHRELMYLKTNFGDFLYLTGRIPEPDWEVSPALSSSESHHLQRFFPTQVYLWFYISLQFILHFSFGKSLCRNPDGAKMEVWLSSVDCGPCQVMLYLCDLHQEPGVA